MSTIGHSMERAAAQSLVNHFYDNLADPEGRTEALLKMVDMIPKFYKEMSSESLEGSRQRSGTRKTGTCGF